jgi:hypothetical protein
MKTRMLKWFDVFVTIMFAIPDLFAIGVTRWRTEAAKQDSSELARLTAGFSDQQIIQLFGLVGMAIVVSGMDEEPAIAYAVRTIQEGAGESTNILELREMSSPGALASGAERPIQINLTPETTFEQYIAQLRDAGGLPDYDHAPGIVKSSHRRDFNHIKAHLYEDFEEFAADAPAIEQANIAWRETEVEDVGVPDDYHGKGHRSGIESLIGEVLGEALRDTMRGNPLGHSGKIH